VFLNLSHLYPEFENGLRKSVCLSLFSKGYKGFVIYLPRSSPRGFQGLEIKRAVFDVQYNESDKKLSYLKPTLEGHAYCLLKNSEGSVGVHFRIEPTCIIIALTLLA
jgi:hypothetical protein